jgi:hypothetical protein
MPENEIYVSPDRDRGYFCISDAEGPLVQGEATRDRREIHIMGDDPVVIDKMFGPLIFFPIRVTADIDSGEWVVERQSGKDNEWHEEARIAGQRKEDFAEADD